MVVATHNFIGAATVAIEVDAFVGDVVCTGLIVNAQGRPVIDADRSATVVAIVLVELKHPTVDIGSACVGVGSTEHQGASAVLIDGGWIAPIFDDRGNRQVRIGISGHIINRDQSAGTIQSDGIRINGGRSISVHCYVAVKKVVAIGTVVASTG